LTFNRVLRAPAIAALLRVNLHAKFMLSNALAP